MPVCIYGHGKMGDEERLKKEIRGKNQNANNKNQVKMQIRTLKIEGGENGERKKERGERGGILPGRQYLHGSALRGYQP